MSSHGTSLLLIMACVHALGKEKNKALSVAEGPVPRGEATIPKAPLHGAPFDCAQEKF
jgi:hypothetical protein